MSHTLRLDTLGFKGRYFKTHDTKITSSIIYLHIFVHSRNSALITSILPKPPFTDSGSQ